MTLDVSCTTINRFYPFNVQARLDSHGIDSSDNWAFKVKNIQDLLLNSSARALPTSSYFVDQVATDILSILSKAADAAVFMDIVTDDLLKRALSNAKAIIDSRVFSEQRFPEVSIDPYGEICFTMRRSAGYVDIGVDGNNQLSYHVRNDLTGKSTFDDVDFSGRAIPPRLVAALREI